MMPNCTKSFARRDNLVRHQSRHGVAYQEIFSCSAEDDYKGILVENPIVKDPDAFDIKPFANMAIHPAAFEQWRFQAMRGTSESLAPDCERYFSAHPEERESALRGDPKWKWTMPPAGPEFHPQGADCLVGKFKLDIKRDNDVATESP